MKKLLLILGAIGLGATSAGIVVSCASEKTMIKFKEKETESWALINTLGIKTDEDLAKYKTSKELHEYLKTKIEELKADQNTGEEVKDENNIQTKIEQRYSITIKDKSGNNIEQKDKDENTTFNYGKQKDKFYFQVEYKEVVLISTTNDENGKPIWKDSDTTKEDWASFVIVNQEDVK